jgi:hypothetical protein
VDETTTYDLNTKFPPGFDLLTDLSIPEPSRGLLQAAALAALAWLVYFRRQTSAL